MDNEGEKKMLCALIESAFKDMVKKPKKSEEYKLAKNWFEGNGEYLVSFEDVCGYLRFDAQKFRHEMYEQIKKKRYGPLANEREL